ncbi:hypothetical protein [Rhodococcus sp. ACT016]|uniref:hypothetical protein n=1 Tax=Rhodococcus sp. ACT016 TaxID=3134808 RepID=UPI003D29F7A6
MPRGGADVGCQGEVGSACSMAAAAPVANGGSAGRRAWRTRADRTARSVSTPRGYCRSSRVIVNGDRTRTCTWPAQMTRPLDGTPPCRHAHRATWSAAAKHGLSAS